MLCKGLVSAIRTLTIVPVPGSEPEKRNAALPWFAVAGAAIGLAQFGCGEALLLAPAALMPLAGLFLAVINYVLTGGLHLDGLADTADAFGTRHSGEKTLAILKDPHIGSFGVAALVSILMWRALVYQQLVMSNAAVWIVFALAFSRMMQGLLLCRLPYARGTEGKAHGFGGTALMMMVLLAEIAALLALSWYVGGVLVAAVSILGGVIAVVPLVLISLRRIGGITGDIVGAATELFECAFLTGALACGL